MKPSIIKKPPRMAQLGDCPPPLPELRPELRPELLRPEDEPELGRVLEPERDPEVLPREVLLRVELLRVELLLLPEDEEEDGRVEGDVVLEDLVADDLFRALEVRAVPAAEEVLEMERQMVLGASGSPLLPVASSDLLVNKRPPPPLELTEVEDQMGVLGATTTGVPVYKSPPAVLPEPV
jgi:hypothetical protein